MKPVLMLLASFVLLVLVFLSGVIITANVIAEPEPHKFAHMDTPDLWTSEPEAIDTAKQTYQRLPATESVVAAASTPALPPANTSPTPATETASAVPTDVNGVGAGPVDSTTTASIGSQINPAAGNNSMTEAQSPAMESQPQPSVNAAQAQYCYARYRSYRIEDNSYQPFNGGARRQCQPPGSSTVQSIAPQGQDVAAMQRQSEPRDEARPVPPEPIYEEDQGYGTQAAYSEPQNVNDGVAVGSHEEWCFARYRSYRVEDNSYQPFEGGARRACQSPFG